MARPRAADREEPTTTLSQYPSNAVDIYKLDEGQVGIPFAIYPSALFYKKGLFEEVGLTEPPHKYGEKYSRGRRVGVADGTQVDWNYDTARKLAKLLTVDKNDKDATAGRLRPDEDRPVGLRAPARRPARAGRLLRRRLAGRRRRQDRPDPGRVDGRVEVLLRRRSGTDHMIMTGPAVREHGHQPRGLSRSSRGKVAMSENFLWSTYGVGDAGDDWDLAAVPVYNGTDDRGLQRGHVPHPEGAPSTPTRRSPVLTYLLGDAAPDLLADVRRHPGPERPRRLLRHGIDAIEAQTVHRTRSTGRSRSTASSTPTIPNFESFMPAYNASRLSSIVGKYLTKLGHATAASTWTRRSQRSRETSRRSGTSGARP